MTTLATDTFQRSDQSGWGTASDAVNVWSLVRGLTTLSIVSNQGVDSGNSGLSGPFCIVRCGSLTTADSEQVVTFNRATTSDVAGLVCRYADTNNWYVVNIGEFTNNLVISKKVAGSYSDIAFGSGATYGTGATWSIRFQNIGTALRARIWDASGAEPGTWNIDTTDTSFSAAGGFGILTDPFTTTPMTYTAYNATDATTGPTLNPMTFTDTLSGADVLNAGGAFGTTESLTAADFLMEMPQFSRRETLSVLDLLQMAAITSVTSTTPVLAQFRSGLVEAPYRDGLVEAPYRDGVVLAGGR